MAYSEQLWQDAKKKCRLTDEDIARAKRLGLNPRSLIKNIPSKSEPWKAPVSACFQKIEEIIRAFEEIGSGGGIRHDFG